MPIKLPPLSAVRVFETAARHGSFKKAAEELNITASAVSHAVQNLEDWLGVELFRHGRGKLELTEPGTAYGVAVGAAMKTIAEATARLPGRRALGRLTISSAPGFTTRWLIPRLPRFAARFPDVSLDIQTSHHRVDLPMEGIDIAIRLAPSAQPAERWTHLMAESLVPVCSPALRKQHATLSAIELVSKIELIHLTSTSADWAEWFRRVGIAPDTLRGGLRIDSLDMALEAASQGLGIALGRAPLFDREIDSGRLVRIFDDGPPSGLSYWLITMDSDYQSEDVKNFRQWMLDEIAGMSRDGGKRRTARRPLPASKRRVSV